MSRKKLSSRIKVNPCAKKGTGNFFPKKGACPLFSFAAESILEERCVSIPCISVFSSVRTPWISSLKTCSVAPTPPAYALCTSFCLSQVVINSSVVVWIFLASSAILEYKRKSTPTYFFLRSLKRRLDASFESSDSNISCSS